MARPHSVAKCSHINFSLKLLLISKFTYYSYTELLRRVDVYLAMIPSHIALYIPSFWHILIHYIVRA